VPHCCNRVQSRLEAGAPGGHSFRIANKKPLV
jgi:hypothetical protein